jgi:uncharacterized protein (TIGR00106 family)
MKTTAELQVIPMGAGASVRREIERVVEVLRDHDLKVEPHASGTNLEGELQAVLDATAAAHETLHNEGAARLVSSLRLDTRADKENSLAGKAL